MLTLLYNNLCASTLAYIAPFGSPSAALAQEERLAIARIFRLPCGSLPPSFFHLLQHFADHKALLDIRLVATAAQVRTFLRLPPPETVHEALDRIDPSEDRFEHPAAGQWANICIFVSLRDCCTRTLQ